MLASCEEDAEAPKPLGCERTNIGPTEYGCYKHETEQMLGKLWQLKGNLKAPQKVQLRTLVHLCNGQNEWSVCISRTSILEKKLGVANVDQISLQSLDFSCHLQYLDRESIRAPKNESILMFQT